MASPFRTFRKNQKAWMVGLTIMTMFAFVFLGQVAGNRSGAGGEYKDPEIFSWKYGTVHKQDVDQRMILRRMINQFLAQAALKAGQSPLFDAIRDELAARYVEQTFSSMIGRSNGQYAWFNGDTPADRWEYFCRLNRKLTAEILPVAVEKFVAEIPDPSADELRKFY